MNSINIIGSGLTTQQLRLDIVSENVTNSQTTRAENGGGTYRRKMVVFEEVGGAEPEARGQQRRQPHRRRRAGDPDRGGPGAPLKLVYDPTHPDANEDGYLELPNVDMIMEIADAMAASRAFVSNVTAFNTLKSVIPSGLEISR